MNICIFLAVLLVVTTTASCGGTAQPDKDSNKPAHSSTHIPDPTPTNDIPATVRAVLATEIPMPTSFSVAAIKSEIKTIVSDTIAAIPTPTPTVTPDPTPIPTATFTPIPIPTATPTVQTVLRDVLPGIVRIKSNNPDKPYIGSGVVVKVDSSESHTYILTVASILQNIDGITVIFSDGHEQHAMIYRTDGQRNLALLRTCCISESIPLPFGDALTLEAGTDILSIGYTLDINGWITVTKGIVSAIRYESQLDRWIIQTDTQLNAGAIGGPLLSRAGKLLGINMSDSLNPREMTVCHSHCVGPSFVISEITLRQSVLNGL